eukprot:g3767.t1
MKLLRFVTLLLLTVLSISTEATFSTRTLLQQNPCVQACNAASRNDTTTLQTTTNDVENSICHCFCDSNNGEPLLHFAVRHGCHECIERLIDSPLNCPRNTTDSEGNTAMHTTALYCQPGMDQNLIRLGFHVDTINNAGDTPLCVALRQRDPNCGQVIRVLVAGGARRCFRCSNGGNLCEHCSNPSTCNVSRVARYCLQLSMKV